MAKKRKPQKKSSRSYSTIEQHKRLGKSLIPPFATFPNLQPASWADDRLPEMLWATLLVTYLERDHALHLFRRMAKVLEGVESRGIHVDITHSGIAALPNDLREPVLSVLGGDPVARLVLRPLMLLDELPAREQWLSVIEANSDAEDWNVLKGAIAVTFYHQSQEATDCRWVRVLTKLVSGQLKLPSMESVEEILSYPDYGDMAKVRPSVRATEGVLDAMLESPRTWPSSFWAQCWRDTKCEPNQIVHSFEPPKIATTTEVVRSVRELLASHFINTTSSTGINPEHDATFGLAAYSLSMCEEMLRFANSESIIGRIALRSVLECYVTLAYLTSTDAAKTWQLYRQYGAGQAKLAFLKLADRAENAPSYVKLEVLERLANEDQWQEFTSIGLGNWDDSSLRSISEKARVKETYDDYYPWSSAFVHGNWAAIRNSVFDVCTNPLHRFHRIVKAEPSRLEDVLEDVCTLTDRILELVDAKYPSFSHRISRNL